MIQFDNCVLNIDVRVWPRMEKLAQGCIFMSSHRRHDSKKTNEDCEPGAGRIADKISMFECPAGGGFKQPLQTLRSADASPVRRAPGRLRPNFDPADQRSRPDGHHLKGRSSSASPCRDRPMTVKERAGTFTAASAMPPHSAMTGMSPQPPARVTPGKTKSAGQDSQGKLDAKVQMQTNTKSKIALKPDGLDAVPPGGKITIPVEQPMGSRADEAVALETADQSTKKEAGEAAKGQGEPEEMTNNISPQSKGPARTASRSKRRKSKESTPSTTPNGENTTINPDQDTVFVFKPTDEGQVRSLDDQLRKNIEVLERQEEHSSVIKEDTRRQEPELSVNKDEPDTSACSAGTKTCIDKETEGSSVFVTQEERETSEASREPPTSSSLPAVKEKQEPPGHSRSEEKHKGEIMEPSKNESGNTPDLQKDIKLEGTDKSKTSDKANRTEKRQDETSPQQPRSPPDAAQNTSERRGNDATDDSKKGEVSQTVKKPTSDRPELTVKPSGHDKSMPRAQKDRKVETPSRRPETGRGADETVKRKEVECIGAVGGTKGDRGLSKAEKRAPTESGERTGTAPARAAEKPRHSALMELTNNSPSDSHGANYAELPSERAATVLEKMTVEVNHFPLPPTTPPDGGASDSSVGEPVPISASESASKAGVGHVDEENTSAVKSGPSGGKISEGAVIVPQGSAVKTEYKIGNDIVKAPLKGAGKMEPQPADCSLTENSTANALSTVANGDVSQRPQPLSAKAGVGQGKARQTSTPTASPEASKLVAGSAPPLSLPKTLNFSWGMSKEDSDRQQDAPSSWLDVDLPKERLRVAAPKLNSSGSESNLLDTSGEFDDEDFVEKIKKLCSPFSLPPRKHNPLGPPQPPFALPAIKEDRFEKTFDPEEFKFGLRKSKYTLDAATSTLNKLHNMESTSGQKPLRASLSDRSILLSTLDTQSRLKTAGKDEEEATDEKEERVKVKSRLEGSCVLSSLTSSLLKGKRNGVQPQPEGTNSGEVSPSNGPQPGSPPSSQPLPPRPTEAQQSPAPSRREEAPALVNDSGPPLPSFTDFKLPDYFEKYLPQEARKPAQDEAAEQEQLKNKVRLFLKCPD